MEITKALKRQILRHAAEQMVEAKNDAYMTGCCLAIKTSAQALLPGESWSEVRDLYDSLQKQLQRMFNVRENPDFGLAYYLGGDPLKLMRGSRRTSNRELRVMALLTLARLVE